MQAQQTEITARKVQPIHQAVHLKSAKPEINTPFSQSPNAVMKSKNLSIKAKYLHTQMINKPDGWIFQPRAFFFEIGMSDNTGYKYMRELIAADLVYREEKRDKDKKFTGNLYHRFSTAEECRKWKKARGYDKPPTPSTNSPHTKKGNGGKCYFNKTDIKKNSSRKVGNGPAAKNYISDSEKLKRSEQEKEQKQKRKTELYERFSEHWENAGMNLLELVDEVGGYVDWCCDNGYLPSRTGMLKRLKLAIDIEQRNIRAREAREKLIEHKQRKQTGTPVYGSMNHTDRTWAAGPVLSFEDEAA